MSLQKDREGVDPSDLCMRCLDTVYQDYMAVYTDGSGRTGSAFAVQDCGVVVKKHITDYLPVHKAELIAILLALQWVEEVKPDRVVI